MLSKPPISYHLCGNAYKCPNYQLVCAFKKKKALSTEYCETSRMFVGSSSDNVGVRSLVKGVLGPEESWMVVQAKRRRDREDVYKKNPGLDPVFMKI